MPTYVFTVVLDRQPNDEEFDRLFESGCDDGSLVTGPGVSTMGFERDAPTLAEAITSAVHDIESAGFVAVGVLDEDLLTLADIGTRIGQSRESVRRYATGERGPGGFPPPVNPDREGTTFYRWSAVVPWIREKLGIDVADTDPALVAANAVLQLRQQRGKVKNMSALTDLLTA